jgi:hypothetical protein
MLPRPAQAAPRGGDVVGRLLDGLTNVRRIGDGRWKARCPAHEDRSPSLAVRELEDGRVLLHCFAGCDAASIVGAIGLRLEDLFPKTLPTTGGKARRPWAAADLLHFVDREGLVVLVVACKAIEGGRLTSAEFDRVRLARERIASVVRSLPR